MNELTFGQRLVGLDFNPSGSVDVIKVKTLFAEIADIVNTHNESKEKNQDSQRLFSHTVMEILNAQMNTVKLLTYKY